MDYTVLLVEDSDDVREMYQMTLSSEFTVETAVDGEDAMVKIMDPSKHYDIILLDVMMPKLDGISVLKKIKAPDSIAKGIPVFLFTNLGMDEVVQEATQLGAVKCMIKANVLPEQIIEEVKEYLLKNPKNSVSVQAPVMTPPQTTVPSQTPVMTTPNPVFEPEQQAFQTPPVMVNNLATISSQPVQPNQDLQPVSTQTTTGGGDGYKPYEASFSINRNPQPQAETIVKDSNPFDNNQPWDQ